MSNFLGPLRMFITHAYHPLKLDKDEEALELHEALYAWYNKKGFVSTYTNHITRRVWLLSLSGRPKHLMTFKILTKNFGPTQPMWIYLQDTLRLEGLVVLLRVGLDTIRILPWKAPV